MTVTSVSGETMMTLFRRVLSQTYTQTVLSQHLHGRYKNQFLLYLATLANKWSERRLKRMTMFLSIFGKPISPSCFYCSNSQGNFEMTSELFGYQ